MKSKFIEKTSLNIERDDQHSKKLSSASTTASIRLLNLTHVAFMDLTGMVILSSLCDCFIYLNLVDQQVYYKLCD